MERVTDPAFTMPTILGDKTQCGPGWEWSPGDNLLNTLVPSVMVVFEKESFPLPPAKKNPTTLYTQDATVRFTLLRLCLD